LASHQVGEAGHVIGVDMTPEIVNRALANANKGGFTNTDFCSGEIEYLSPVKQQVFHEVFRFFVAAAVWRFRIVS
jgi:arsenite methyltransferase